MNDGNEEVGGIEESCGLSVESWEVCDSNTGSVVATENTGSNVVRMENEDSDGDGIVNGGVGYGEVIVKV
ncbi:hypothetical protein Tco_0634749 [Tanacetum coccineum]